jgi:diadenylate cyclase
MVLPLAAFGLPSTLRDWVEVGLLFVALLLFLRFLRKTIAGGVFRGPAMLTWVVIVAFFLVLPALNFEVLAAILQGAFPVFIMALVVIFQPELRHGIARLGQSRLFRGILGRESERAQEMRAVDEIVKAIVSFSERKIGALIAIERNIDLSTYIDTGVPMDAVIRAETLDTIFSTKTVLHDGAVIVRRGRIAAAGSLLPLTERPQLARKYGTRHRAAIGLSEQSDATVIVASEETGTVSVAERGELQPYRDPDWLAAYLNVIFAETQGLAPRDAPLEDEEEHEGEGKDAGGVEPPRSKDAKEELAS